MNDANVEPDAIRKRPAMFIGDTADGSGLANMIWEVLANSLDEHLAGRCRSISVEIREDGAVVIEDDGRGVPLDDIGGITFAEKALTTYHTTPTLDGHAPHEHVSTHGVGIFPVNALSSWLTLEVFRNGRRYAQRFERGVTASALEELEATDRTGTRITFLPDPAIFSDPWIDPGRIAARLRELSWLLPGLMLRFSDHRRHLFHEPRGLRAFLTPGAGGSPIEEAFILNASVGEIQVEVVAEWRSFQWSSVESFANIARTTEGGSHVRGLLRGLAAGLRRAARVSGKTFTRGELQAIIDTGLHAVVCVRLQDPTYDSPTRSKLATPEVESAVRRCVRGAFSRFLESHATLLDHLVRAAESRRSIA